MLDPQEAGGHKKGEKKSENKKKDKETKTSAPVMNGTDVVKPAASLEQVEKLKGEISIQGDKVRTLKTSGAAKVWQKLFKIYAMIHVCMHLSCTKSNKLIVAGSNLTKYYQTPHKLTYF